MTTVYMEEIRYMNRDDDEADEVLDEAEQTQNEQTQTEQTQTEEEDDDDVYDEEEEIEDHSVQRAIFEAMCQHLLQVLFQEAMNNALSDRTNPRRIVKIAQKNNPKFIKQLDETLCELSPYLEEISKEFVSKIGITYQNLFNVFKTI